MACGRLRRKLIYWTMRLKYSYIESSKTKMPSGWMAFVNQTKQTYEEINIS